MNHCVYILHSIKLNRYYIGYSSKFEERLTFHENPEKRKYTHRAKDWTLFYIINCHSKLQALEIEKHIKNMKSKIYIENLLKYNEITIKLLEKYKNCNQSPESFRGWLEPIACPEYLREGEQQQEKAIQEIEWLFWFK